MENNELMEALEELQHFILVKIDELVQEGHDLVEMMDLQDYYMDKILLLKQELRKNEK